MPPARKKPTTVPPEAALINRRRTDRGLEGPLSIAKCADMLDRYTSRPFSDRTWSSYEQGKTPIPDRELVLMALVVGATPEELGETNRHEAAELLRQELANRDATADDIPAGVSQRIHEAIQDIREMPGLTDQQRSAMINLLLEKVNTLLDQHRTQLDIMRPPNS